MSADSLLYIPDLHAHPEDKFDRLKELTKYVRKRRLRVGAVVVGGDVWDMESLCLHDKGKAVWSQRSFEKDLRSGMDALSLVATLSDKMGATTAFVTEGNHEERLYRFLDSEDGSRFDGTIPRDTLSLWAESLGFEYIPFLKTRTYEEVNFAHYFTTGLMGRPISGDYPAANMLRSQFSSCVACHKHTMDYAVRTAGDGRKLYGFVGGCFTDLNKDFTYAGPAQRMWWNGVSILHFTAPGEFDVETISQERILADA